MFGLLAGDDTKIRMNSRILLPMLNPRLLNEGCIP